jgi:hypothetical protein
MAHKLFLLFDLLDDAHDDRQSLLEAVLILRLHHIPLPQHMLHDNHLL